MTVEKIIEIAHGIISSDIGVVAGSRMLLSSSFEVTNQDHDPDFILFMGIDSESHHIPLGEVRNRWSESGLAKVDAELREIEYRYRRRAIEAAEKLIGRYTSSNT